MYFARAREADSFVEKPLGMRLGLPGTQVGSRACQLLRSLRNMIVPVLMTRRFGLLLRRRRVLAGLAASAFVALPGRLLIALPVLVAGGEEKGAAGDSVNEASKSWDPNPKGLTKAPTSARSALPSSRKRLSALFEGGGDKVPENDGEEEEKEEEEQEEEEEEEEEELTRRSPWQVCSLLRTGVGAEVLGISALLLFLRDAVEEVICGC